MESGATSLRGMQGTLLPCEDLKDSLQPLFSFSFSAAVGIFTTSQRITYPGRSGFVKNRWSDGAAGSLSEPLLDIKKYGGLRLCTDAADRLIPMPDSSALFGGVFLFITQVVPPLGAAATVRLFARLITPISCYSGIMDARGTPLSTRILCAAPPRTLPHLTFP